MRIKKCSLATLASYYILARITHLITKSPVSGKHHVITPGR